MNGADRSAEVDARIAEEASLARTAEQAASRERRQTQGAKRPSFFMRFLLGATKLLRRPRRR